MAKVSCLNVEALLLAPQTYPSEEQRGDKPGGLLQALLNKEQLLKASQRLPLLTYEDGFEIVGEESGLSPPVMLCKPCSDLMRKPPRTRLKEETGMMDLCEPTHSPEFWIPFHRSLSELMACHHSSKGSCRLCHLFWRQLCSIFRRSPSLGSSESISINVLRQGIDWFGSQLRMSLHEGMDNALHICFDLGIPLYSVFLQCYELGIHIHQDFRKQEYLGLYGDDPGFGMSQSTGSPATFSQMKVWLDRCKLMHTQCQPLLKKGGRPTRLIKIEDDGKMFRLKDDLRKDVKYIAVSYRWGPNKTDNTLKASELQNMKRKHPIDELPKTLRDACEIAHRLGFEYVWIDRLCILQDDRKDWEREASRMDMVYTQSSFTIAASCASGEDSGCFRKRNPAWIMPLRLRKCPLMPVLGNSHIAIGRSEVPQDIQLGHLVTRGWTFQEWVLPARVIHFASEQVFWQCRQTESSEAWPVDLDYQGPPVFGDWRPALSERHSFKSWMAMIRKFSARELTEDSDKLPAISGLARAIQELAAGRLGEYYAGLWEHAIVKWLCWRIRSLSSLPKVYVAPSWSWASLNAEARVVVDELEDPYCLAEFRKAELKHVSDIDHYGAIKDGWIWLSGYLKPVRVQRWTNELRPLWASILDFEGKELPFYLCPTAYFDVETTLSESPSKVFNCLPLLKVSGWGPESKIIYIYCLLLAPYASLKHNRILSSELRLDTSEEFERVALLELSFDKEYWDEFQEWLHQEEWVEKIVIR